MPASSRTLRLAAALAVVAATLPLIVGAARAAEPEFPVLTGRVVDAAGILSGPLHEQLTQMLAVQERSTGQQIVVVTLKSLQGFTIEEFGYQLGRHWGIGQKGQNNGALLIVAPNERKVRIEVGYGLEDRLTDAESRIIIENVILPRFRQGNFSDGTLEGAAAIRRVLGVGQAITGAAPPNRSIDIDWKTIAFVVYFGFFIVFPVCGALVRRQRRGRSSHASWGGNDGSSGSGYSSSSYSSSGSSSGSDSFSSGGGDFGGGGASDSW
jgi:uncharacterized protein